MSDTIDHREQWGEDLAAYALDALSEPEAAALESHVAECDWCTERLRWLQPAIDILPATVPQEEPPPALRARLMEVVESEAPARAEAPAPAGASQRSWSERLGFSGWSLRPALAGLAVLLIVAAGVAGYALSGDDTTGGQTTETFTARGVGEGKLAHGTLEVQGDKGSLQVANLPATKPGEVYQAWVEDTPEQGGAIHPSSVFVVADDGSGHVVIPSGLEAADRVMVTREPKGGSEKPHESSIITANLD